MKLPLKSAQTAKVGNWHANFRVAEGLPDLKPIRTSFFINLLFITLAVAALLFTAHREFLGYSIRSEIELSNESVAGISARNAQLLSLNQEFNDASVVISSAEKFLKGQMVGSQLLISLSRSLPDSMDFTSITFEGGKLILRGNIRGASETASTRVTAYLDVLRKDEIIGNRLSEISLTSLVRDPRTQGMSFEIVLKPGQASTES
jgi:Tfp pilus assembly protein PilN